MERGSHFSRLTRFLIASASLGVTILVVQHFAGFINTIIVAIILGILFVPMANKLQARGLGKGLALTLTMATVVAIMVGLFLFFLYSIARLGDAIPQYAAEMDQLIIEIEAYAASLGLTLSETQTMLSLLDPSELVDFFGGLVNTLLSILSDGLTVLLTLAFLLVGASTFSKRSQDMINNGNPGMARLYKFNSDIRHYVIITNNVGMAAGAINTVLLLVVGVDFAILWGVLSWLLSYIPFIGFFLALIPPTLLALLEFGWPTAIFVLVAYVLINSAIDDIIKPRMMGRGLDLAPVMVFVSVVFWGLILGPLGGILAVPVTVGIKQLVLEPDPDNRWIAELISGHQEPEEEPGDS